MRAILAGGGTGGHVIPALAIAHCLKESYGTEVLFVGTARGIENRLVPNVVPGFANRLVAPVVSAAAVHFEETGRYVRRFQVTGVPVRHAFFETAGKRMGHRSPTLLVFGGSQGAHAINQVVIESLAALRARVPEFHIIHQTGERDYNDAQAAYLAAGGSAEVYPFIDDMPGMFVRSDLLLCRSGASTVAEVMAAGKPAIFVPFPRAADDHQKRNAELLERAGAAVMLEEASLNSERLVQNVGALLGDQARLEKMSAAARSLAHPDAAREIADMAARFVGVSRSQ